MNRMNRRAFLGLSGAALTGLAGCNTYRHEQRVRNPRFAFAGVIVESLSTAKQYQPLSVTVSVEKNGAEIYQDDHTVQDVVHGEAFRVTGEWAEEQLLYSVTLSSSVHEPTTQTTAKLDAEDDRGKFSGTSLWFRFQLTANTILFRPMPVR